MLQEDPLHPYKCEQEYGLLLLLLVKRSYRDLLLVGQWPLYHPVLRCGSGPFRRNVQLLLCPGRLCHQRQLPPHALRLRRALHVRSSLPRCMTLPLQAGNSPSGEAPFTPGPAPLLPAPCPSAEASPTTVGCVCCSMLCLASKQATVMFTCLRNS